MGARSGGSFGLLGIYEILIVETHNKECLPISPPSFDPQKLLLPEGEGLERLFWLGQTLSPGLDFLHATSQRRSAWVWIHKSNFKGSSHPKKGKPLALQHFQKTKNLAIPKGQAFGNTTPPKNEKPCHPKRASFWQYNSSKKRKTLPPQKGKLLAIQLLQKTKNLATPKGQAFGNTTPPKQKTKNLATPKGQAFGNTTPPKNEKPCHPKRASFWQYNSSKKRKTLPPQKGKLLAIQLLQKTKNLATPKGQAFGNTTPPKNEKPCHPKRASFWQYNSPKTKNEKPCHPKRASFWQYNSSKKRKTLPPQKGKLLAIQLPQNKKRKTFGISLGSSHCPTRWLRQVLPDELQSYLPSERPGASRWRVETFVPQAKGTGATNERGREVSLMIGYRCFFAGGKGCFSILGRISWKSIAKCIYHRVSSAKDLNCCARLLCCIISIDVFASLPGH